MQLFNLYCHRLVYPNTNVISAQVIIRPLKFSIPKDFSAFIKKKVAISPLLI